MMRTFPSILSSLLLILTLNVKNMATTMAFQITNIGNQYQSGKPLICKHVLSMTKSMSPINTNNNMDDEDKYFGITDRRHLLGKTLSSLMFVPSVSAIMSSPAVAEENYSPSFVQSYEDFVKVTAEDGQMFQYKDVKIGASSSETVEAGDRVVFDWSGYTIGYFGRPFEAKGGPQGGAFDKDLDYSRSVIGSHTIIPALESAFLSMKPGGIRQVVVPYGSLSYPPSDLTHEKVGPKPTTFSGQRALNFVLENPRVDRTLLFNIKLVRLDKKDGKGGFKRGEKL